MAISDLTHYRIICRNARLHGGRTAWYEAETGRSVTFAEFRTMTDNLATALRDSAIGRGDRIGVLAKNSLEFFLLYGAAAAIGAVVLPVNWRLSAGEVAFNLRDGEAKILFADREFEETIGRVRAELPSLRHLFSLSSAGAGMQAFPDLSGGNRLSAAESRKRLIKPIRHPSEGIELTRLIPIHDPFAFKDGLQLTDEFRKA